MDHEKLLVELSTKLSKALQHLQYSYKKSLNITDDITQMDDEIMETWESFSSRFSKASDIFVMQYLHTRVAIVALPVTILTKQRNLAGLMMLDFG